MTELIDTVLFFKKINDLKNPFYLKTIIEVKVCCKWQDK